MFFLEPNGTTVNQMLPQTIHAPFLVDSVLQCALNSVVHCIVIRGRIYDKIVS